MSRFGNLRQRLGYDPALEAEGAWITLSVDPKVRARVVSIDHPVGRRALHRFNMTLADLHNTGRKEDDEAVVAAEVEFASAVVQDWDGLAEVMGFPVLTSRSVNAEVFAEEPDWRRKVQQASRSAEPYKAAAGASPSPAVVEAVAGNSAPPSALASS